MRVKLFDESHEKDLETAINSFLKDTNGDIIDVKYQLSTAVCGEEQIFCFSAMVVYEEN